MLLREIKLLNNQQLKDLSIKDLGKAITKSNLLYSKGNPILTDAQFDKLVDILKAKDPKNPVLKKVGSKPQKLKVKLPYPMYSLAKITPDDSKAFIKWYGKYKGNYVASDKMDGLSLEIVYTNHILTGLFTRGDGIIGQDITRLAPHLNIPKRVKESNLAVRAELIMSKGKFKKHAAKEYKNARNMVAGFSTRLKGVPDFIEHAEVIAYEIINPRYAPSKAFKLLDSMGFKTAYHKKLMGLSIPALTKILKDRKVKSKYDIDGLVVEIDKVNTRPPAGTHSPDYAFAFKINEEAVTTTIKRIDWEPSKHGLLKPVAEIEPVELSGATIKKVTAINGRFVEENGLGKGAVISLVRSGEIIPRIVGVQKKVKPDFPSVPYIWDDNHVEIKLKNADTHNLVRDKRLANFFSVMEIDFVKIGTVAKLADSGYDTILKIIKMKPSDFLKVEGIQDKMANKIYNAIQSKLKDIALSKLMSASGYFGQGFAEKKIAYVVSKYPDILDWETLTRKEMYSRLMGVQGFADKSANRFIDGLLKFLPLLRKSKLKPVVKQKISSKGILKGQYIAFTGFRSKPTEELIQKNGGVVDSGVTKNTTILLVADKNSGSSKILKAEKQGVKILTLPEFLNKNGLSL